MLTTGMTHEQLLLLPIGPVFLFSLHFLPKISFSLCKGLGTVELLHQR